MSDFVIRPYESRDLDALYEICLRTGDSGEDATGLLADGSLLGNLYSAPYGVLEPGLAFVMEDGEGVCGYVIGALDTVVFEERIDAEWFPRLREAHPLGSAAAGSFDDLLVQMIHHPVRTPAEVTDVYPSHLHIDLLPRAQGGGRGKRMIFTLLDALAAAGSPGVHFGVSPKNTRALGFYDHLGFTRLNDGWPILFGMALPRS